MFSSPRSSSSRSSQYQGPNSPQYPPSPHPELIASPKSIAADVFERVATRSYTRTTTSGTSSTSPFTKGNFPRPESSLYYTASLRSLGGDSGEVFGGELITPGPASISAGGPANSSRAKVFQSHPTNSGGIGVLSALIESSRRRGGSGETQFLQRRYTEEWIRRYQRPLTSNNPEGKDLDDKVDDEEGGGGNYSRGHRSRNHSNAKTITQADIATILKEDQSATGAESSDNDGGYLYYMTAPQSMAETVSTDALPVPSPSRSSMRDGEVDILNRPASTVSSQYNGTITPTAASSHLAPLKPPTRTSSRASVRWNGKNVIISFPICNRDESGVEVSKGKPLPLTRQQVLEKLRMWEALGYNIEMRDANGENGQSREIYPEERTGRVDKSEVIVCVPDMKGKTLPKRTEFSWVYWGI